MIASLAQWVLKTMTSITPENITTRFEDENIQNCTLFLSRGDTHGLFHLKSFLFAVGYRLKETIVLEETEFQWRLTSQVRAKANSGKTELGFATFGI